MANEIARQLFHIAFGFAIILAAIFFPGRELLLALFGLLLLSVLLSLIATTIKIPLVNWFLERMGRGSEKLPGRGFIFFIAGCLLALKLFPQRIALAAIAVLTFGDAASTLAGSIKINSKYSNNFFNRNKTYYGTIIGWIVAFPFAMLFTNFLNAVVATTAGMLVEALSIKFGDQEIDDNFIIPLAAGTACYLLVL